MLKKVRRHFLQCKSFSAAPGSVCLQEPVPHLCVSVYKSFSAEPGSVCLQEPVPHSCVSVYKSFSAAPRSVCLQEPVLYSCVSVYKSFSAAPRSVCLQEPMPHLCVSVYKSFSAAPGSVWLQEPVPHLCVSVYKSFSAAPGSVWFVRVCLQELWLFTWTCLSTRDLCCTWTSLPTRACAATMRVCLQESSSCCTCRCTVYTFFSLFSVCFETGLKLVLVVSIYVRNTETNRNKPKQSETDWVSVLFGFKPKIFFVCFEDTLVTPIKTPYVTKWCLLWN